MTFDTAFERSHKPNSIVTNEKDKVLLSRDEFAAAALTGMLAGSSQEWAMKHKREIAREAYEIADEMLRMQNETTKENRKNNGD